MEDVLTVIKTMIDAQDITDTTHLDEKLNILIDHAARRVLAYLPEESDTSKEPIEKIPGALQFVIEELTVTRFNRIGNEGMSSYSQEGESLSFSDDDMKPYLPSIQAYLNTQDNAAMGIVRFL